MTPKEKAKELVYKYQNLVPTWDCYNDCSLEIEFRLPNMIQCALIAVDEMLDFRNKLYINEGSIAHQYLLEVKKEIEKL